jgi:hypothetical protein
VYEIIFFLLLIKFTDKAVFRREGIRNFNSQYSWEDVSPYGFIPPRHQQGFLLMCRRLHWWILVCYYTG